MGQWLGAGVRLVWVINPGRGETRVYRADGRVEIVAPKGELQGEGVSPGLRVPLSVAL